MHFGFGVYDGIVGVRRCVLQEAHSLCFDGLSGLGLQRCDGVVVVSMVGSTARA